MEIDPRELSPRECYGLLIACVVPRPIAWLSTVSPQGTRNLAPFSFFGGVTATPPTVMVSIGRLDAGSDNARSKDSAQNLIATGVGVIHIPQRELAGQMVATSARVAADVDEFELAGLRALPARKVSAQRIDGAAIAMEARVSKHLTLGKDDAVDTFFLELVYFHIDDELLSEGEMFPDAARLRAVGRLGGPHYCDTENPFSVARPE